MDAVRTLCRYTYYIVEISRILANVRRTITLSALIRLFSIQICVFIVFRRLLNNKIKYNIFNLLAALATTVLSYYVDGIIPILTIPIMIITTIYYIWKRKIAPFNLTVITCIISYGICCLIYTILAIISSFVRLFYVNADYTILSIILMILQVLVSNQIFMIKRLKKGMPFIKNIVGTNTGILISILLLSGTVIMLSNNYNYIFLIPYIITIIAGGFIFMWWRNRITKSYINNIKDTELKNLKEQLEEKERKILHLEQQNSELAKIIHKDNKLIPSLEFAVKSSLEVLNTSHDLDYIHNKGQELLAHVEDISRERYGIITTYQLLNKDLPKTKVSSIDALLSYMLNKASASGVIYDVNVMGSIKYMVDNIITENDLATLLAELIDNALIATKSCDIKRVLVTLGVVEDKYVVYMFDSGEPFAPEVLNDFGKKQITTHQNEGGSGIGLMTIHDIVSKYKASIEIITLPADNTYTKQIAISFPS